MKKGYKVKGTTEIVYAMARNYDSFPYPDEYLDLRRIERPGCL